MDGPHHSVQLVTIAARSEPASPSLAVPSACPWRRHLASLTDNYGPSKVESGLPHRRSIWPDDEDQTRLPSS
jgi:hypothetical protein